MLIGALITFLVVILILYLINLLPIDGRAKQIARVVVIVIGEFAPLLLGLAFKLLPVAFNPVPIHRYPPLELRSDSNGRAIQTFRERLRHRDDKTSEPKCQTPSRRGRVSPRTEVT